MKYHFSLKLLAFFLAACLLLAMVGSALSIVFLSEHNLYRQTVEDWEKDRMEERAKWKLSQIP